MKKHLFTSFIQRALLMLLGLGLYAGHAYGQGASTYGFAPSSGTFTPITGGTAVTTILADDAQSASLPIGFTFTFGGTTYTAVAMGSNGYLTLNAAGAPSTTQMRTADFSSTNTAPMFPLLGVMWNDMTGVSTYTTPAASASYITTGTAGSQVFIAEWLNYAHYQITTGTISEISFQVKLYEATGVVEFIYRKEAGTGIPFIPSAIGIATAAGNYLSLDGPSPTATASSTVNNTNIVSYPATGQVYTFTPPGPCVAPSAQPTGLSFFTAAASITGNYTAATPAPNKYLVVRTPGTAAPSAPPVNGTTYTVGGTLGTNGTIVALAAGTTFTATGLSSTTQYTFTLYSMNDACTGGPLYNTTSPLAGTVTTTGAQAYTWLPNTPGSYDANVATNWSPDRNAPDVTDTLYFTSGGSSTATNLSSALFSVAKIAVQNNTVIILNSAATATNFAINKQLIVDAGSTLELSGANGITLSYAAGNSPTATINGNLNLSGTGTCVYNSLNSVTTVGTGGIVTVSGSGTLTSTASNTFFNGTAQYVSNKNGGSIPTATYASTSLVRIIGVTTTVTSPPAVIGGSVEWNCPLQTLNPANWLSTLNTIGGNFTIVSTGTGEFQFGAGPNVIIAGSFILDGGTYRGAGGSFTTNTGLVINGGTMNATVATTVNVNGPMTQNAGLITTGTVANAFTFNTTGNVTQAAGASVTTTGTGTMRFNFNGTAAQNVTFGGTISALSHFTLNNAAGVVLNSAIPNTSSNTITNGAYSGPGSFAYNATTSTLTYNSTGAQTATTIEYPATAGPLSLTVAKSATSVLTMPFSRTVTGTLTMTTGEVDLGANTLTLGTSATAPGTISGTGAFFRSGTFTRWFGTTGLPTSAGTVIGYFPFAVATANRSVSVYFTAATALAAGGGTISVTHNPAPGLATGLSIADSGPYIIQNRTNGSWTFVTGNGLALSGVNTIGVRATGTNLISPITVANIRLMQTNAVVGTHVAGTGTASVPQAARTGLTIADLNASPYHIGAANADVTPIFTAINNGDWGTAATWDGGIVPTIADRAIINTGVTVNIGTGTNAAKFLTNNGTLTVNANTLTIDTSFTNTGIVTIAGGTLRLGPVNGGNRLMTNNGTTTVTSGTLEVNGGISSPAGSTFNQSGGLILIDPNDGTAAGSLIAVSAFASVTNNLNFSAGTMRFVDPTFITNANYTIASSVNPTAATYFSGTHTIELGDGTSTTQGGANGFRMYSNIGTGYAVYRNITVNGGAGAGRFGNFSSLSAFSGTLTVNAGSEARHGTTLFAGGNIVNNGRILTISTLTFGPSTAGTYTLPAAPVLSGTGEWRNKIPTVATHTTPGTGYALGDVVALTGGTFTTPATFLVTAVNGTGGITGTAVVESGSYTVVPTGANGVTTITGIGTGAAFTMQATATSTGYLIPSANVFSLTTNNTNGVVLPDMLSYSGTLTFTLGKMVMGIGTGTMIQIAGAGISGQGATTGWTVGAFQKAATAGGLSHFFPIGDATNYTPVNIAGTAATPGDILVSTTAGDHPNMGSGASGIAADKSVNRYYTITSLNGITYTANSLNVTFNWTAADLDAGANTANFIGAKLDAGVWTQPLVGTRTQTSIILTGISDFSAFQIGEPYDPLAIKLVHISAANVGVRNRVDWTSATETAGDYYELERSTDGKTFARIATIEGTGKGADYTYYDELPVNGLNYYRLKLVNIDAQSAYSRTVTATVKAATTFVVEAYPNPVTDKLTVNVTTTPDGAASITLVDLTGKVVRTAAVDGNRAAIDMNGMPAGIYMLRYQDASHDVTIKVTKQ